MALLHNSIGAKRTLARISLYLVICTAGILVCYGLRNLLLTILARGSPDSVLLVSGQYQTCRALLTSGKLFNESIWEPDGCKMIWYSTADAEKCFRKRTNQNLSNIFEFYGDSRTRYLSYSMMEHFGFPRPSEDLDLITAQHSRVPDAIVRYEADALKNRPVVPNEPRKGAALVVNGGVFWYISTQPNYRPKNRDDLANLGYDERLDQFKRDLLAWGRHYDDFVSRTSAPLKVVWQIYEPVDIYHVTPWNISNDKVDLFNAAASHILKPFKNILVWRSARLLYTLKNEAHLEVLAPNDALHIHDSLLEYQAQMLLNLVCNQFSAKEGACCGSPSQ